VIALFVFTFSAFGLAYVLGHSMITKAVREYLFDLAESYFPPAKWLVLLVECPACLGFWIGFVSGLLGPTGYAEPLATVPPLALGCYVAGTNFVLGRATGLMPQQ
jgi:hypothetical protein